MGLELWVLCCLSVFALFSLACSMPLSSHKAVSEQERERSAVARARRLQDDIDNMGRELERNVSVTRRTMLHRIDEVVRTRNSYLRNVTSFWYRAMQRLPLHRSYLSAPEEYNLMHLHPPGSFSYESLDDARLLSHFLDEVTCRRGQLALRHSAYTGERPGSLDGAEGVEGAEDSFEIAFHFKEADPSVDPAAMLRRPQHKDDDVDVLAVHELRKELMASQANMFEDDNGGHTDELSDWEEVDRRLTDDPDRWTVQSLHGGLGVGTTIQWPGTEKTYYHPVTKKKVHKLMSIASFFSLFATPFQFWTLPEFVRSMQRKRVEALMHDVCHMLTLNPIALYDAAVLEDSYSRDNYASIAL